MINLSEIKCVVFDLDGTIYCGSKIICGANETIKFFRQHNKKIYFATNNSAKTRLQVFLKLKNMGIDCSLEEILTSGYLTANYALQKRIDNVYICGTEELKKEFQKLGLVSKNMGYYDLLVIGYNPKVSYEDISKAVNVALSVKEMICCNKERLFPGNDSKLMPGCGAMVSAIEWCSNRKCDVVIGKPSIKMLEMVKSLACCNNSQMLVIGDTYESDCKMAINFGAKAILINHNKNVQYDDVFNVKKIINVSELFY